MVTTFHDKWQIILNSPEVLCNNIIHDEFFRWEWNTKGFGNFVCARLIKVYAILGVSVLMQLY